MSVFAPSKEKEEYITTDWFTLIASYQEILLKFYWPWYLRGDPSICIMHSWFVWLVDVFVDLRRNRMPLVEFGISSLQIWLVEWPEAWLAEWPAVWPLTWPPAWLVAWSPAWLEAWPPLWLEAWPLAWPVEWPPGWLVVWPVAWLVVWWPACNGSNEGESEEGRSLYLANWGLGFTSEVG